MAAAARKSAKCRGLKFRHMIFSRARQFEFIVPRPALIMGVVNVTPDSFSDGGKFFNSDAAITHALKLVAQGG